tara:strand:+ start:1063 stop:1236 length:174 start_codon:yes stop_codon:yes gene_type:complete
MNETTNIHTSAFVEALIARHEAEVKLLELDITGLTLRVSGLKQTLKEVYHILDDIKY